MFVLLNKYRFELVCIIPLLLFLFALTIAPVVRTFLLSLEDPGTASLTFSNYKVLLLSNEFRRAAANTVFIAVLSLIFELTAGLLLALVLSYNIKGKGFARSIFILPLAIPTVVVGVIMSYLFSTYGWINKILSDLSIIESPIQWMGGGYKSLLMVALADSWKVTPIVMLLLLSGLESIDRDLYKAARVDGAGSFYIFKRVTLPMLFPYITACIIIRGIDAFRIFSIPLILMGQNMKVIGIYAYLEYVEYNNPHLSAASSVMLLGIIFFAFLIYIKAVGKKGVEVS